MVKTIENLIEERNILEKTLEELEKDQDSDDLICEEEDDEDDDDDHNGLKEWTAEDQKKVDEKQWENISESEKIQLLTDNIANLENHIKEIRVNKKIREGRIGLIRVALAEALTHELCYFQAFECEFISAQHTFPLPENAEIGSLYEHEDKYENKGFLRPIQYEIMEEIVKQYNSIPEWKKAITEMIHIRFNEHTLRVRVDFLSNEWSFDFNLGQRPEFLTRKPAPLEPKKLKIKIHDLDYAESGRWFNFLNSWDMSTQSFSSITSIEELEIEGKKKENIYGYGFVPSRETYFCFKAEYNEYGGARHLDRVTFLRNAKDGRVIRKTIYSSYDEYYQSEVEKAYLQRIYGNFLKIFAVSLEKGVFNALFSSSRRNALSFRLTHKQARRKD